ncbi:alpha/beta fold hydrolase [Psychrobacter sp. FDAARGOS_221]|uniref:alpha/beta fold hydrolase n=1 Tax=Psychrobacter sp. FDAARGOS_221 TaxID=1975705 RepID=UPI000BB56EE4|nr:alpha/beta hydrolase [Psychrobacter sp. FDAARGOS_221]PNK60850.1 alpha/beta hydrolase [Psychrobacter sp. FDAARGOS_221]
MTATAPDYQTDPFFNLKDQWINTSANEVTHYYEQGDGVPVLLLHGSGIGTSAAVTWWLNIPTLSQAMRCIAFDFIGYGKTKTGIVADEQSQPESQYGIRAWGAHTLRLMDALGIEKAWVMGSSLGGWVGLQLALDYPERILGVISIGTGGAPRKPSVTKALLAASDTKADKSLTATKSTKPAKPPLSAAVIEQDLQKNIRNDAIISDTLVSLRLQAAQKEVQFGLRPILLAARDRDREQLPLDKSALAQLSLPVLLIHGADDKVVPLDYTLQLLQAIPDAEAHVFNGCGHWPHIGKAESFNRLVIQYLNTQQV